jgi:hypothetical protein
MLTEGRLAPTGSWPERGSVCCSAERSISTISYEILRSRWCAPSHRPDVLREEDKPGDFKQALLMNTYWLYLIHIRCILIKTSLMVLYQDRENKKEVPLTNSQCFAKEWQFDDLPS